MTQPTPPAAGPGDPPPAADPPVAPPPQDPPSEPFDEARARSTIAAQRESEKAAKAAAKAAEDRAKAAEDKLKAIEDAEKSELERAQARTAELEAQATEREQRLRDQTIRAAVLLEATKQGAIDAEAVFTLIDRAALVIEGEAVTNAEQAVKNLLAAKPYLVAPDGTGGNGIPATPRGGKTPSRAEQTKAAQEELQATGRYGM
ncbi:MAG: hypothetical protein ACSLE9_08050 [Burkholderiaceae bacterium]